MDTRLVLHTPIINLEALPPETRKIAFHVEGGKSFLRCYDQAGTKIGAALYDVERQEYLVEDGRLAWYRGGPVAVEDL